MRGCSGVECELFRSPQHDDRTSYNLADPCKRIYAVPAFPEVNIIASLEGKFRISRPNLQTRYIIPQQAVAIENLETMPSRYFLMGLHDEYDAHIYCYTRLLLPRPFAPIIYRSPISKASFQMRRLSANLYSMSWTFRSTR